MFICAQQIHVSTFEVWVWQRCPSRVPNLRNDLGTASRIHLHKIGMPRYFTSVTRARIFETPDPHLWRSDESHRVLEINQQAKYDEDARGEDQIKMCLIDGGLGGSRVRWMP